MTWQVRRFANRAALAGALVTLVMLAGSATASAHSYFMQSDPADGSILERAPSKVVVVFSSPVAANFTKVKLVEAGGAHYAPTSVVGYPGQSNIVVISLPEIAKGSYRLTFVTRDSEDLHQTAGTIVFGIGVAPPATAPVPKPVPAQPSEFLLRWLALTGLAGVMGGVTVALVVIGRLPGEDVLRARVQRSLFGLALVGTGLVLCGETGLLALQASSLGPIAPSIGRVLTESQFGTRWLVTLLLAAGLAPLLISLWMTSRRRQVPGLAREIRKLGAWSLLSTQVRVVLLCIGLGVALAFSGHVAGAAATSVSGVTLLALHLVAMGVWVGGLVALGLALLVVRRAEGQLRAGSVMALVAGFGPIAGASFGALGVTGLLLSGTQVASVTALLSTQYGAVLIGKMALIGFVALFGLRHALLTLRGLARRGPQAGRIPRTLPLTIALEAIGAIMVVLLAAVLGASAPARGPQFDPLSSAPNVTQVTREQDGLLMTLSVKPNKAGPNLIGVQVVGTRRPEPAPVQRVTVTVLRPNAVPEVLATTPSGLFYDAGSVKLAAGDVRFTVKVERAGIGETVDIVPWQVTALEVQRAPVVISDQRVAPVVDALALVGVLMATLLVIGALLRQRRGARRAKPQEIPKVQRERIRV